MLSRPITSRLILHDGRLCRFPPSLKLSRCRCARAPFLHFDTRCWRRSVHLGANLLPVSGRRFGCIRCV